MPEKLTVTAKVPAKAATNDKPAVPELGPCTVIVNTGKDDKEMVQMFGGEAVKTNADANWTVTLQGNIRSGLRKGETPDQIAARLAPAKMGVAQKGVQIDPVQAYLAKFQGATPQEQQNMLNDLKKRAASAAK
jgi:hypothetical protein